jgi:mono/diheme cytochrome c family protein
LTSGGRALGMLCTVAAMMAAFTGIAAADSKPSRPEAESYVLHCSGCHRLDGSGVEGVAPDLREIGPLMDSPAGRDYLVRVPGVAQAPMNDADLARLLNWVLVNLAGRVPAPAYTASEVASLRREPLRDPLAARRALNASVQ